MPLMQISTWLRRCGARRLTLGLLSQSMYLNLLLTSRSFCSFLVIFFFFLALNFMSPSVSEPMGVPAELGAAELTLLLATDEPGRDESSKRAISTARWPLC